MTTPLPRPSITATRVIACCLGLSTAATCAWAGRPLATEDAGVNAQAYCQLEVWIDHGNNVKHGHFAPACGVLDGLELGAEWDAPTPSYVDPKGTSASLKWSPESWNWNGWRFGAKTNVLHERQPGASANQFRSWSATAIASYPYDYHWTFHFNVGHIQDRLTDTQLRSYGGAVVYAIDDRTQVFAEINGNSRSPATQAVGLRWWFIPETLGLDVTTSRTNATTQSQTWGIGFGWYGLHF
ncbi:MAG TPA: hypothetical protein VFM48_16340 [Aquabacterium sp.]|nr:hypothetical protein [Aquabacterium sp.]